jgi:uncharacterized protein YegP (UPF0339 family)
MKVTVYQADNGEWSWRAQDGNHRIIATAAETYTRKRDAVRAARNTWDEYGRTPLTIDISEGAPDPEPHDRMPGGDAA